MSMPKSPNLFGSDIKRLKHYTARAKAEELTPELRREARKKRAALMLSLRRAGWRLPPIAEAVGVTLSVAREQIVVLPATIESVEVTNPKGEKVTPDPLPEEFQYGDLTEDEVRELQYIAPVANANKFNLKEESVQRKSSALLDFALAYLYDKKRRPTDMARAISSSNSLVRARIRRAKGGMDINVKGHYAIPDSIKDDVERLMSRI
jgi:uncharacterized protein YnzC (UPF0291/DUF896 family)